MADGAPGENSPFAASILKVLERNRAPRLNVARLADQVVEMTRSNYTQLPEGNPLQGVGHEGGQYIFQLVGSEPVLWQRCTQEGSIAALNAYLDAFPDGPHAAEALERIALIEEDQHWKEAQRRDTISAYRTFLGKFPKGAQAETARKRIRELQGKEEKPLETARPTPTPVPQEPAAEVKPTPTTAPMEAPAGGPRRKWYLPVGILAAIAVAVVLWALFGRKGEPEYAEVPETTARETDDRRPGPEEPGIPVPELVFVPGGAFLMGCTEEQGPDCADDERPPREMEVGDFLIGRFELTFAEYDAFCRDTNRPFPDDEGWGRDRLPAIHISCLDAIDYCNWLSEMEGLRPVYFREGEQVRTDPDANGYRLPTEAEWEFAARARHNEFKYAGTSREEDLPAFANFTGEADGFPFTAPVGSLEPNELGLHDMSGNVREWCWNPSRLVLDERLHILRGGAWNDDPPRLRVSSRSFHPLEEHGPGFGFRVCRSDL